jgi:hypothetical protein
MAAIDFFIDTDMSFGVDLVGSGLGFYGASFGTSVAVGEYQDTTYVTDTNGVVEGPACRNVKWTHANSGEVSVGPTNLNLQYIPNYQSTLNVRFTHSSAVKCQNVEARIYDRNNINVAASGVTTKVAEIIHPDTSQAVQGSGDAAWYTPEGSSVVVPLAQSPGESGEWAGNGTTSVRTDDRHDWFLAISGSPDSIGSKTQYGLYVSLEYL